VWAGQVDSIRVKTLRWPALACLILSVGCGQKGHKSRPIPVASTPLSPVITPAEAAMGDAARAEVDGRSAEALRMYESLVISEPAPSPKRLQALMASARLRLAADPALRDLSKARAYLVEAGGINPKLSATLPIADLLALLAHETEGQAQQEQQDQRASALRTENRTLRGTVKTLQDELAKAQEELAKKDEALHRATEKLLERAPRSPND
jgi:hypothetical protein